jgi:hypothetical protein
MQGYSLVAVPNQRINSAPRGFSTRNQVARCHWSQPLFFVEVLRGFHPHRRRQKIPGQQTVHAFSRFREGLSEVTESSQRAVAGISHDYVIQ